MGSRDHRIVVFSCRFLAIRDDNDGVINNLYPLVNIYKKLWKNTMISRWYIMVNQLFQWTMASTANCNKLPEGNQGAAHCHHFCSVFHHFHPCYHFLRKKTQHSESSEASVWVNLGEDGTSANRIILSIHHVRINEW